jgi:phospholipid/cholesterol/gamma-HCH transport system substrate-binding protein
MVMINKKIIEVSVGIFILLGGIALFLLALKVSGWTSYSADQVITVYAYFDEIGDLKVRVPVKIAGVRIGEIKAIDLNNKNYKARVTMLIDKNNSIPTDSTASILSTSLLGSHYISIAPGFSNDFIKDGAEITETNSAVILENLIGQAMFKPKDEK